MSYQGAIASLTDGICSTVFDSALFFLIYTAELSMPFGYYGKTSRAEREAYRFLQCYNWKTFKRAIAEARRRHYIAPSTHGKRTQPEITKMGKARLAQISPRYLSNRPWDHRIYLVTYDIPEQKHRDRDLLREYLRSLGCGKLQGSVWVTPYDPKELIEAFVIEHRLPGTIIVSNTGIDGSIGDEDVHALMVRVYRLEDINTDYEQWLEKVRHRTISFEQLFSYLSIVKRDPQLPFSLLPAWWKGDEAYRQVAPFLKRIVS